jgi:hypothetical protein
MPRVAREYYCMQALYCIIKLTVDGAGSFIAFQSVINHHHVCLLVGHCAFHVQKRLVNGLLDVVPR